MSPAPRFRAARPLRQGRSPPWILVTRDSWMQGGTRGAGDGIRVDVRAVDAQADYQGRLTQDSHSVNYPVGFAVPFSCAANVSGEREGGRIHGCT